MKGAIDLDEGVDGARTRRRILSGEDALKLAHLLLAAILRSASGKLALDDETRIQDFHDLRDRIGLDDHALARNHLDQALDMQPLQRLVHRRAPEPELGGDVAFLEILTRQEVADDDALLELLVGLERQ